ncbi:alkaline-phosphatase-like protein [Circinella umbellata]|nr:alkaline-phosphatase-like protein [Circinella umbellata]
MLLPLTSNIIIGCLFTTLVAAGKPGKYKRVSDPEGQFYRLGGCPDPHACIIPPDLSTFLPGALLDLRVELHAYDTNTSNPVPEPYKNFKTTIRKDNGKWVDIEKFFELEDLSPSAIEHWNFSWVNSIDVKYADVFDTSDKPVDVAVSSRIWRKLKFDKPGTYDVSVQYGPKDAYTVRYTVVEPKKPKKKAKNAILFIADGCNVGMIAAVRAITKKHTSGKYHEMLSFEDFDQLGHVMTQSVDSLVTDSANSASAYSTGHKSSSAALGVYADSSESPFDDPKVELITELIRRRQPKKAIGVVSTAAGHDATPAAFYVHTRDRDTSAEIIDQIINGVQNWTDPVAPDVWLGGGAQYFQGEESLNGENYFEELKKNGYQIVMNKKELKKYHGNDKLLGTFRTGHLDTWIDRNMFVNNTIGNGAAPDLSGNDALGSDQPGLTDMTLKALEVLKKRGGDNGFFLMAEAASVDKQLHGLDFPRAFADLIEMEITIKKTVEWLKKNDEYEDTLILFTADHAHGFDVYGSVDQSYMTKHASSDDRKRSAVGLYQDSGWPSYDDKDGDGFPDDWTPNIVLAAGTNNGPEHFEAWKLAHNGPRKAAVTNDHDFYIGNVEDPAGHYGEGIKWNGNLPVTESVDSHTMTDVFIYANGPGSDFFRKTIDNWQVFFGITEALDLQRSRE